MATIAPVLAAVVLWAITRSPLTLVFAALGPVIAVASLADSRFSARKSARRANRAFALGLAAATGSIEEAHSAERSVLDERHPDARAILARRGADPWRWSGHDDTSVAIGRSTVPSRVELDLVPGTAEPARSQLMALAAAAAGLSDAPVVVDAAAGIGVCGPPPLASAVARGLAIRLAWRLPPDRWHCGDSGHPWTAGLPHRRGTAPGHEGIAFESDTGAVVRVAVAEHDDELPAGCGVVLSLEEGGTARISWHPDPAFRTNLRIEAVGAREAGVWAIELRAEAARHGFLPAGDALPSEVALSDLGDLGDLDGHGDESARDGLSAAFSVQSSGPLTIDLVADGPHAVIGGTTGSGKSELLIAWVVALAARYSPGDLSFLLVDFKGGSAFGPLAGLPHTTGTITDLDGAGAARALASLRAEVRHRERELALAGARDITGVQGLARLVIMVDEFAAMLAEHPDLHPLFADLAARGRSLGIHLVLCTQRPSGVLRDSVLANADLRISLRVNNRADSTAVIGTDAAAAIPAEAKGRALVCLADRPPVLAQFARASAADAVAAAARWPGSPPARRPWIEPLPGLIRLSELDGSTAPPGAHLLGLVDRPDEQRRDPACWIPGTQGNLLVLGGPAAGATTVLGDDRRRTSRPWLPTGVESAWDAVADQLERPEPGVLLFDDLDALIAKFPPDHRTEFGDRLVRIAREGPETGAFVAAAMRRIPGELQVFAALLPARLLLRHPSRQDFVLAGGDGSRHDHTLPPGGGIWQDARVQIAVGERDGPWIRRHGSRRYPAATCHHRHPRGRYRRSARLGRVPDPALEDSGSSEMAPVTPDARVAIVGDVEAWQARWGALATLRPVFSIVFDACSTSDLRQLARSRRLPPPIGPDNSWLLEPDGAVNRTRLAGAISPARPTRWH